MFLGRWANAVKTRRIFLGRRGSCSTVYWNKSKAKTKEEITDWFNIEVWDKQADFAGEWVKKGTLVAIEGRLASSKWTTPDGETLERYLVRCSNIRLMGSKKEEN